MEHLKESKEEALPWGRISFGLNNNKIILRLCPAPQYHAKTRHGFLSDETVNNKQNKRRDKYWNYSDAYCGNVFIIWHENISKWLVGHWFTQLFFLHGADVQLELTMFATLWSRFISLKIALFKAASCIKQNILLGQGTAWKISWKTFSWKTFSTAFWPLACLIFRELHQKRKCYCRDRSILILNFPNFSLHRKGGI